MVYMPMTVPKDMSRWTYNPTTERRQTLNILVVCVLGSRGVDGIQLRKYLHKRLQGEDTSCNGLIVSIAQIRRTYDHQDSSDVQT
jgi:hypothetical protein